MSNIHTDRQGPQTVGKNSFKKQCGLINNDRELKITTKHILCKDNLWRNGHFRPDQGLSVIANGVQENMDMLKFGKTNDTNPEETASQSVEVLLSLFALQLQPKSHTQNSSCYHNFIHAMWYT